MQLTGQQALRMMYALHNTYESMAMCNVGVELRRYQLQKVANELLKEFEAGAETPESPTEKMWREREVGGARYGG